MTFKSSGTGKGMENFIPKIWEREGRKKSIPEIREREGNKNPFPKFGKERGMKKNHSQNSGTGRE